MNNRWSNLSLLGIMVVMTIVTSNLNWGGDYWKSIIESDGKGYYAYLPATFIYHDLNFGFFEEIEEQKYYNKNLFYDYRVGINKRLINKYYCGTAVAELPFFLITHAYCLLSDHPPDGYSKPYTIAISVAALFYLFLGLLFTGKVMELLSVKWWWTSVTLIALTFGTNLFYYTVAEPSMSHVYSFAFVAMFIFYARQLFATGNATLLIVLGALLGIIGLIRPLNLVVLLTLPFIAGSWSELKAGILLTRKNLFKATTGLVLFLIIISVQLIIYKLSTNQYFVYSYAEEGFNFGNSQIIDILFSYKKGLFLYTPIYLLSLLCAGWIWRRSSYKLITFFAFFFLLTYLLSSWWNWWYGGSFSSRVYVDFLPVIILPLAVFLNKTKLPLTKVVTATSIFCLILLCQIQTYQYRYYIIHWENMTKEMYWDNFLTL